MLDPLEQELRDGVRCHVDAGTKHPHVGEPSVLLIAELSFQLFALYSEKNFRLRKKLQN